jgi:hypothetical protein
MQWDIQAIGGLIIIAIGFGAVVVYPKLQYNALRRLRGIWRALGALPLVDGGVVASRARSPRARTSGLSC